MIDLKLDPVTHDLVIENFTFAITTRIEDEVVQRLKVKLLWFKNDWIHNINFGIPYFEEVFIKGVDLNDLDDLFRTQISNEDGVQDLLTYSSSFNQATRQLTVNAKVITDSGEIINLSFDV